MKKTLSIILTLVLLLGTVSFATISASAASYPDYRINTGMYLRIDGIEGDSADGAHANWIDVLSFKQENSGDRDLPITTLTISHYVDRATNSITKAFYTGQYIYSVTFEKTYLVGGSRTLIYSVNMGYSRITSVSIESDAEGNLIETFTIMGELNLTR